MAVPAEREPIIARLWQRLTGGGRRVHVRNLDGHDALLQQEVVAAAVPRD